MLARWRASTSAPTGVRGVAGEKLTADFALNLGRAATELSAVSTVSSSASWVVSWACSWSSSSAAPARMASRRGSQMPGR
jgi:hypothetical protein